MPDFIPTADSDFNTWQTNFFNYANANLAALGLVAADMTPVMAAMSTWSSNYTAHVVAHAAAISARENKDIARKTYEMALRALIARLQTSPTVTDARRAALGIPVRSKTKTPVSVPNTRPFVLVSTAQRLQHLIQFHDEGNPSRRARPRGIMGVEIWVKIGDAPPSDPSECIFLALDTATPYLAQFPGAQAGKMAHYILRWVNTRGEHGPWSETASATIVG